MRAIDASFVVPIIRIEKRSCRANLLCLFNEPDIRIVRCLLCSVVLTQDAAGIKNNVLVLIHAGHSYPPQCTANKKRSFFYTDN